MPEFKDHWKDSPFAKWFIEQYGGLPDPARVQYLRDALWAHTNAMAKLAEEKQKLDKLQQSFTDALYAWQAREKT